jgi:hypothetical protein
MALNQAALSTLIQNEIQSRVAVEDTSKLKDMADAIAAAVVSHIKSNLSVVTTTTAAAGTWTGVVS